MMTPCKGSDTRWCCGESDDCCKSGYEVVELPTRFSAKLVSNDSSITSSSTSDLTSSTSTPPSSISTPPSLPSSSPPPAPGASSGVSPGVSAGIGIGAGIGVIALIGLISWLLKAKRRKNRRLSHRTQTFANVNEASRRPGAYKGGPTELPIEHQISEIGTYTGTTELAGDYSTIRMTRSELPSNSAHRQ